MWLRQDHHLFYYTFLKFFFLLKIKGLKKRFYLHFIKKQTKVKQNRELTVNCEL
jgi:hypothetical protein